MRRLVRSASEIIDEVAGRGSVLGPTSEYPRTIAPRRLKRRRVLRPKEPVASVVA